MCRSCCEYERIVCQCPSQRDKVGYAVPCCRNDVHQCDPCIIHQGCSVFDNCKRCNNGTWEARDDFYISGSYCRECRQGWSGGNCLSNSGTIYRPQKNPIVTGLTLCVFVYRCRFTMLSLESDHSCRYDYVEVRDGDNQNSPVIGRYCGDNIPAPVRSSGDSLHIRFVSDGYNNYDGFSATFREISACSSDPCMNGGICSLDPVKDFQCSCRGGFSGSRCELSESKNHTFSGNNDETLLSHSGNVEPSLYSTGSQSPTVSLSEKSPLHRLYSSSSLLTSSTGAEGDGGAPAVVTDVPAGFHLLYTSIEYQCSSPLYQYSGSTRRTCLKTGKWSGRHVSCSPGEGSNRSETRWPWHAAVYHHLPPGVDEQVWQLVCCGALVSQVGVVVPAHCVTEPGQTVPLSTAQLRVVLGKHHLRDGRRIQHLQVSEVLVHPNYDPDVFDSDLAVLKLLDKAKISEFISPVCLPRMQGGEVTAQQAFITGWSAPHQHHGPTAEPGSRVAQTGVVELADVAHCERQYSQQGIPVSISDNMLCGRQHPTSPSTVCPSRTGGVVLVPDGESDPVWELLGLVSFGYDLQKCNPGLYTVYTRVTNFKNWIEKNIK
uniref:Inactive serine protease PAMR1 n=1 Tax=Astyanax mexicanus TaxID=7994 RepID=A0A8B9H9X0_ASTMX